MDKEEEYRTKLQLLSPEDLSVLDQKYHRNTSIHWLRELLPSTPELWDRKCFKSEIFTETVSLVIPYHNEDIMLLLRTITTIVHRTPPHNLLEILLIDDCSDDDIADEVRAYAEGLRIPVKLSRNDRKLGVANSRLLGIDKALGDVIMILDSHMEVGEVWVEPLLRILVDKPRALAVPRLRMRNEADSNAFDRNPGLLQLVDIQFGFGLVQFGYPKDPRAGEEHVPIMSPGLFGGAFAGYRSYLLEIYPLGVLGKTWGIENSRISIRSWCCGQGIYVSPCSFVAHTNGPDFLLSRYSKEQPSMLQDLRRESMAEVINFIRDEKDQLKMISKLENTEEGKEIVLSLSEDIKCQFNPQDLHCKDFNWHSDHILSQMIYYRPVDSTDSLYVGEVKSLSFENVCLEMTWEGDKLILYGCRSTPLVFIDTHVIQFTKNSAVRILSHAMCWELDAEGTQNVRTLFFKCHAKNGIEGVTEPTQRIVYNPDKKWIRHEGSNRCLDATGLGYNEEVRWTLCNEDNKGQLWEIKPAPWF